MRDKKANFTISVLCYYSGVRRSIKIENNKCQLVTSPLYCYRIWWRWDKK